MRLASFLISAYLIPSVALKLSPNLEIPKLPVIHGLDYQNFQSYVRNLNTNNFVTHISSLIDEVKANTLSATNSLLENDQVAREFDNIQNVMTSLLTDDRIIPLTTALVFTAVLGGFGQDDSRIGNPFADGTKYDANISNDFYSSRPLFVFRRLMRLAQKTAAFNIKLLLDWKLGNLDKNADVRANEALQLATQLGPTFIKLGQALSIRTDLIPRAYALSLRQLQDAVPPFDSQEAFEIIKSELKVTSLTTVFSKISEKPVSNTSVFASLSLSLCSLPLYFKRVHRLYILGRECEYRSGVQSHSPRRGDRGGGQGAAPGDPLRDRARPAPAAAAGPAASQDIECGTQPPHCSGRRGRGDCLSRRVGTRLRGGGRLSLGGEEHEALSGGDAGAEAGRHHSARYRRQPQHGPRHRYPVDGWDAARY